jgi:mono/diheme cytochrome c family protein
MNRTWFLLFAIAVGFRGDETLFAADAVELYIEKCAPCHGASGEGTPTGPAHKGNPFITKGDPAEIKEVIMKGREGAAKKYPNIPVGMPGRLVSESEADLLVKYMKGDLQKMRRGALRDRCKPGKHRGPHCDRGMR